jgi:hypothetical protein
MWMLLAAAPSHAAPVGFGLTGLYDLPGAPEPGFEQAKAVNCGADGKPVKLKSGDTAVAVGCGDELGHDIDGLFQVGVVVPVYFGVTERASLRTQVRATVGHGTTRLQCGVVGGCQADLKVPKATYTNMQVWPIGLELSVGPEVRFGAGAVAPFLHPAVGGGLNVMAVDSDLLSDAPRAGGAFGASAVVGVGTAPNAGGWFVDAGWSASYAFGASFEVGLRTAGYVANGPRLDAGLRFGARP